MREWVNMSNEISNKTTGVIITIVVIIMLLLSGMFIVFATQSLEYREYRSTELLAEVARLRIELDELSDREFVTTVEIVETLNSAVAQGNAVAAAQNDFPRAGHGVTDSREEIIERMGRYLAPNNENNRLEWFAGSEVRFNWEFMTTYAFRDDRLPVVWIAFEESEERRILAYTTAMFCSDTNLFSNFDIRMTSAGLSTIGVE